MTDDEIRVRNKELRGDLAVRLSRDPKRLNAYTSKICAAVLTAVEEPGIETIITLHEGEILIDWGKIDPKKSLVTSERKGFPCYELKNGSLVVLRLGP